MARRWSETEIQVLNDNVGLLDYTELSHRLNRSKSAIKLYRARNNMPTFYDNFYTYSLLAKELGKSRSVIRKYHETGRLHGVRAKWNSLWGMKPMMFIEKDIVAFLKKYHELFKWQEIPNIYFRNIVKDIENK